MANNCLRSLRGFFVEVLSSFNQYKSRWINSTNTTQRKSSVKKTSGLGTKQIDMTLSHPIMQIVSYRDSDNGRSHDPYNRDQ